MTKIYMNMTIGHVYCLPREKSWIARDKFMLMFKRYRLIEQT